jgi:hypothetical protein
VKDDEFEGHEEAQKAMKMMLPPLLDGMQSRTKALQALSIIRRQG